MGMVGLGVGVYVQYTRNTKGELGSHSRPGDWRGGHPASITAQTVVLRTLEDQEGVLF